MNVFSVFYYKGLLTKHQLLVLESRLTVNLVILLSFSLAQQISFSTNKSLTQLSNEDASNLCTSANSLKLNVRSHCTH